MNEEHNSFLLIKNKWNEHARREELSVNNTKKATIAPPIPPKPQSIRSNKTQTLPPPSAEEVKPTDSPSLLTQQLDRHVWMNNNSYRPVHPIASRMKPNNRPIEDDPFSPVSSDDSDMDSADSNSNEGDYDTLSEQLKSKLDCNPLEIVSTKEEKKTPPPPPPPTRKYHQSARSINHIPTYIPSMPLSVSPPTLPPRPPINNLIPQLPPRPSQSTLARAHTIAHPANEEEVSLHRAATIAPLLKRAKSRNEPRNIYPDLSQATRNPPFYQRSNYDMVVGSKGSIQAVASSRNILVTGGSALRTCDIFNRSTIATINLDQGNQGNDTDRIRALLFAPTHRPQDEGRYLWVGRQDNSLSVVEIKSSGSVVLDRTSHTTPINFLLRYSNTELWSIDDAGILKIWDVGCSHYDPTNPFDTPRVKDCKVLDKASVALIYDNKLWMFRDRSIHSYSITADPRSRIDIYNSPEPCRISNDLGRITQMVSVPYHPGRIFASHDNGKISIWDSQTREKIQVITVSMYGICTMTSVGEFCIWAGYNTGMIYVYDTRPERWVVLKMWKAHTGAVNYLTVDESDLILSRQNQEKSLVISTDTTGVVNIWDGLLTDYWKELKLLQRSSEFCTYNNVEAVICSWNIDANKPERISQLDESIIRNWLCKMKSPDIIAVGIQEIVDLESKKQTARSLFFKKKMDPTETEEVLTHRYKLWYDYLVDVVNDKYGENAYTVIKTDQLVGLFSCIFVRKSNMFHISNVESTSVKTGLKVMNKSIHGNKGGIAIRFMYDDSSLCFVNCHLAAGQSHTKQRNADVECILQASEFPSCGERPCEFVHGGDGSMILDHEFVFLSGDLNYRIQKDRKDVLRLLGDNKYKEDAWRELQSEDQLLKQYAVNPFFKLLSFQEAPITFAPTYKYEPNTNIYDQSEKQRVPAWCDRILYKGHNIKSLSYDRFEVLASDHRPIASALTFHTKKVDYNNRRAIASHIEEEWKVSIRKYIQDRKAKYITDYGKCTLTEAFEALKKANWDVNEAVSALYPV